MKLAAVILFGLFGFVELVIRLTLIFFVFIMYIDDGEGFRHFFYPVSWEYLADILGVKT